MYAVDDQGSLERLYDEADNAKQFIEQESFVFALVGNKADLHPEINEAAAKALSGTIGASPRLYFYTSAKTGLNVKESMTDIVRALHRLNTGSGRLHSQSLRDNGAIKLTAAEAKHGGRSHQASPNINTLTGSSGQTRCCKQ